MPNEVELKLLIAPADVPRLRRHPLLKAHTQQKLSTQHLLSIYYDTPELTLHKSRIAVRLRRIGRRWVQTVKTEGRVAAGLHERPEWEYDTEENTLDFERLEDPVLRDFFAGETLRHTLRPMFVTEFSRARRILEWPSGEVVELAIDHGEIRAGDRRQPINEVELELKTGASGRLFEFALELQNTIPLKLENVSKAERGYRLATNATLTPEKFKTPPLDPQLSSDEAFVQIAHSCIAHAQANEDGVLQSDDPEFVHQMRVAVRRLRSAISAFSDIVDQERAAPIREELLWLARELDEARNWDVFVLQTLPPIVLAFPEYAGLSWLASQSTEFRRHANASARAAVTSARYQRFLLTFGGWLASGVRQAQRAPFIVNATDPPLADFAARILQRRHRRLRKRGRQWEVLTPEERHRVRIAAKKLRYAAEFFSSLFPRQRTQKYTDALVRVQDILGVMNDAATTIRLSQSIEPAVRDAEQHQAKGMVLGWAAGSSRAYFNQLEEVWRHFLQRKVFWK